MDHAAADGRDDAPLILIVDDERDIVDMLDSYFRLEGYRTIVAHDAAGALAAAHRSPRGTHVARMGEREARGGQRAGRRRARACDARRTGDSNLPRAKLSRQHDENATLC